MGKEKSQTARVFESPTASAGRASRIRKANYFPYLLGTRYLKCHLRYRLRTAPSIGQSASLHSKPGELVEKEFPRQRGDKCLHTPCQVPKDDLTASLSCLARRYQPNQALPSQCVEASRQYLMLLMISGALPSRRCPPSADASSRNPAYRPTWEMASPLAVAPRTQFGLLEWHLHEHPERKLTDTKLASTKKQGPCSATAKTSKPPFLFFTLGLMVQAGMRCVLWLPDRRCGTRRARAAATYAHGFCRRKRHGS